MSSAFCGYVGRTRDGRDAGYLDAGGTDRSSSCDARRHRRYRRQCQERKDRIRHQRLRHGRQRDRQADIQDHAPALGNRDYRAPARPHSLSSSHRKGRCVMSITPQLALWIVLGGLVLMLAGLFVTLLARGMDAKRHLSGSGAHGEAIAGVLPQGSAVRGFLMRNVLASKAHVDEEAVRTASKRKSGVIAALVGGGVALSVGAGIMSDIFDNDGLDAIPESREITAGELHGTLISPKKRAPVVLIVPGSGPTDRDGNNPMGVGAQSYKLLAEALFARSEEH